MKALRHLSLPAALAMGLAACSGSTTVERQPDPSQFPTGPPSMASPTTAPSPTAPPSLVSQDETWNLYTNPRLGIEILVPKHTYR
jgi:hypothetical protein